jgi:hypothetical protein
MTFFDPHLFQLKILGGDSDPESAKYLDLDLDSAKCLDPEPDSENAWIRIHIQQNAPIRMQQNL